MMTREQQLRAAAELLGLRSRKTYAEYLDQVRRNEWVDDELDDVQEALCIVDLDYAPHAWDKMFHSKDAKRKVTAYLAALRRLAAANRSLQRYPRRLWVPVIPAAMINEHITECQQLLDTWPQSRRSSKGDIVKRRLAAREAAALLGHRATTTRRGKWCRLAAILYGDPDADLFHQCCEIAKKNQTG